MVFPATLAFYASILALIYVGLSFFVVLGRFSSDTLHGDGGDANLQKRIRAHGNFIEYVPIALILIGYYEASHGNSVLVHVLLVLLVIARLLHPVGIFAPKNSPMQFICRGGGLVTTLAIIVIAAIALLVKAA